jgi:hypothetical protein
MPPAPLTLRFDDSCTASVGESYTRSLLEVQLVEKV